MPEHLQIKSVPKLENATLLLALTGWMDGGMVSTGTVRAIMEDADASEIARIDPDPFYIYNFPGSMEIASIFRPDVKYADGVIEEFGQAENVFHADPKANLVFFLGKEPNLRWQAFADSVFELIKRAGVTRVIFIGSFGGSVPHTRAPRLFGSVSHTALQPLLRQHDIRPTDYEGPASFATLLLHLGAQRDVEMLSISAEIPSYLDGANPVSIEAVARHVARIIDRPIDTDTLRRASDEWEAQVSDAIAKDNKLAATIRKLENQYDNELITPDE